LKPRAEAVIKCMTVIRDEGSRFSQDCFES